MNPAPARLRSLLFAPASKPDVLRKMPRAEPDGVALDLEDAVPADGKADARVHSRAVGAELAAAHPELAVYVRVNAVASEWFAADVADGVAPEVAGVIVPKLESPDQLDTVAAALDRAGLGHLHVLAGLESAMGVERARELLHPPVAVAYFGAEDFIADMGGVRTAAGTEVLYARSRVALAARLAGVLAVDQVVTRLDAEDALPRRRRPRTRHRLPGQALHPPGPGHAGQPRVLLVARGARAGPAPARGLRRCRGPRRGRHRVRGADGRRAAGPPRPRRARRRRTLSRPRLSRIPP